MDIRLVIFVTTALVGVTGTTLTVSPESPLYIKEGSSFELQCVFVSPDANGMITWYKGVDEAKTLGFTVIQHTGFTDKYKTLLPVTTKTLTKNKIRTTDSGKYRCVVDKPKGKEERIVHVKVVAFQSTDVVFTPGNPISVRCNVGSHAAHLITHWSKDGVSLSDLPVMLQRIRFKDYNTTLEINNSSMSDTGRYQCVMTPRNGQHQGNITHEVFVAGMPYFSDGNNNTESYVGSAGLELRCLPLGYPSPNILWTKDNKQLVDHDRYALLPHKNIVKAIIKFTDFLPEDVGFYSCEATNKHGSSKRNFEIMYVSSAQSLILTRTPFLSVFLCLLTLFCDIH